MDNNEWPKHLYALDVSRGLASLSVIIWHWQNFALKGYSISPDFIRENQPLYYILRLFYEKGALAVNYFFLLSGFIFFWLYRASIQDRTTSAWKFGVQRFSRLYPLHFVTLLVVAMMQFLYVSREGISFAFPCNDLYHFFLNLFLVSKWGLARGWSFNAPIWSVSIEVFLYILFFLMAFFLKGGRLLCLSISVVSFILSNIFHKAIFDGLALFFLGGLVFQNTFLISTKNQTFKAPVYFITILAWSCVLINYYLLNLENIILKLGIPGQIFLLGFSTYILFPFTACCLALVEIDRGPFLKPISFVGDISYSTYLLHFPLQLVFALAVSFGLFNWGFYSNLWYLAIYFMVLILLSYLVFRKFERPMQKMIRSRFLPE
jgi:peptidoglycan/LPS O-acetylase OafA/YrhL